MTLTISKGFVPTKTKEITINGFKMQNPSTLTLPERAAINESEFSNYPLTSLSIPKAMMISDGAFSSVVNAPTTQVTIPGIFHTSVEKDRIFGAGN